MPACQSCQASTNSPASGLYNVSCIDCMVRLIARARGSRKQQEKNIAALERHHKAAWPELWQQVQAALKEIKR